MILVHDRQLSDKAKKTIDHARKYINGIIDQSGSVLSIFSKYAYSDYVFKPVKIAKLEKIIFEKTSDLKEIIKIDYTIDKSLSEQSSLLIPEVLDHFLDQLIKNALKEYDRQEVSSEKRHIQVALSSIKLRKKNTLKISVLSRNTEIKDSHLLDNAGKRPINSSSSTGLGFYFLNTLLELLKAELPKNHKLRYFDLSSAEREGVSFDFYYLIV